VTTAATKAEQAQSAGGAAQAPGALTDGFHLLVDALKLNGVTTIYGVVGIPVTDLARLVVLNNGGVYRGDKASAAPPDPALLR